MATNATARALLWLLLCAALSAAACGGERWLTGSRGELVVFSDLSQRALAKELARLEEFRLALAAIWPERMQEREKPALMIIADGGESMDRFLPYVNDRLMTVSGLFSPGETYNILLIKADKKPRIEAGSHTALHEYLHELTLRGGYYPAWAAEGLAEAFAAFEKTRGGYAIGKNTALKRVLLRGRADALVPLWKLMGVEVGTMEYSSPFHQPAFYNTSWLFAHYCLVSDGRARYADAYLQLLEESRRRRINPFDFRRIFGVTMAEMERELFDYLSVESPSYIQIEARAVPKPEPFAIREASETEALAARVAALRRADREQERAALRAQLESDPAWESILLRQPLLLEMYRAAAEELDSAE